MIRFKYRLKGGEWLSVKSLKWVSDHPEAERMLRRSRYQHLK